MRLSAIPEFGARLVPALAALGLVAITVWFGTVMISREVGIVAGLMLAACPGVFGLARYAILDTLFTMFMFGGAACLAVAALRDRPRLQWLGYVAIALGVQTKGPIALVLCGLTMLLLMALSADLRRRLLALHWGLGSADHRGASSAPWFVYMYLRFEDGFVNGYILDENFRLFAGSRFGNQPGFWFYFQILAAALLPWTGLLIGRLIDDVRALRRGERLDGVETMLVGLDAGGGRVLHAVDLQARSLRLPGGAGAVPARARAPGRTCAPIQTARTPRIARRPVSDRAVPGGGRASAAATSWSRASSCPGARRWCRSR